MKKYAVTALGELLIDFTECGESAQGNPVLEACPGGAPGNVLAILNKYGKKTAFIGKVGNDTFGKRMLSILDSLGIETSGIMVDEEIRTTLAFVHTLPDGDREFAFYRNPGADMALKAEEVRTDLIEDSEDFHFGTLSMTSEPAYSATLRALECAKAAGCHISFDPNLREPLWKDLKDAKAAMEKGFEYCDILKISDNELLFVSGADNFEDGIAYIRSRWNIPLIFLTKGKDGSTAYYKDIKVDAPGYKVNTIETTGAGDTFGGCALGLVLDKGLEALDADSLTAILREANAAAAIVTTRKGALCAMPEVSEVKALMEK